MAFRVERLKEGDLFTIEPVLSPGATRVNEKGDGWTLQTGTKFRTARFEHSTVITEGEAIILTA